MERTGRYRNGLISVGHRDIFRPAQHTLFDNVTDPTLRGDYRRSQSEAVSWGIDLTGSWNKQLKDHYLTANARMSVLENNSETYGNYVTGFPNDNMDNLLFGKKYNEKVTGDERTPVRKVLILIRHMVIIHTLICCFLITHRMQQVRKSWLCIMKV